jgi:hypothetical protein
MTAYFLILIHAVPSAYVNSVPTKAQAFRQHAEAMSKDIAFGQRQVEQFTCDRPSTARIIEQHKFLHWMLVWHFSGQPSGQRVYWKCEEPRGISEAEHSGARAGYPAMIRVSSKVSPVDQCVCLLFELLNFHIDAEQILWTQGRKEQRKTRDEFAESCARLEHRAVIETKVFLWQNPIRNANFSKDKMYWRIVSAIHNEDDYIKSLNSQDEIAYLEYYKHMYDRMTLSATENTNGIQRPEEE